MFSKILPAAPLPWSAKDRRGRVGEARRRRRLATPLRCEWLEPRHLLAAFLRMDSIQGEATDQGHKDWIIIQSMSTSIHRSIPSGAKDQQRTKGETSLGDVQIVRQLDKSSTKLQEACAAGKFFKTVDIEFCTTVKDKQEPYLKYKLYDVIVSSYSVHGDASGNPLPSEQVSLGYSKVDWTYVVVDPKTGDKKGEVATKYNPAEGKASGAVFDPSGNVIGMAPSDIALSATTIAENRSAGAVVGAFTTTDPDGPGEFTYELVAGDGSADNNFFTIVGSELRATAPLDYESKPSLSVRVRSTDRDGLAVEKVFSITVADVVGPLESPVDLRGVAGNRSVSLSWQAPNETGGAEIKNYVVQYSGNNGASWKNVPRSGSSATSTTVTGLVNGRNYVFRVASVNSVGAVSPAVTSAPVTPRTVAGRPLLLSASGSDGQMKLKWKAPGAGGGVAISDYVVQFSGDKGLTWTTVADGVSAATSVTVSGLSAGRRYTFRVGAVNEAGTGQFSTVTAKA